MNLADEFQPGAFAEADLLSDGSKCLPPESELLLVHGDRLS